MAVVIALLVSSKFFFCTGIVGAVILARPVETAQDKTPTITDIPAFFQADLFGQILTFLSQGKGRSGA